MKTSPLPDVVLDLGPDEAGCIEELVADVGVEDGFGQCGMWITSLSSKIW